MLCEDEREYSIEKRLQTHVFTCNNACLSENIGFDVYRDCDCNGVSESV